MINMKHGKNTWLLYLSIFMTTMSLFTYETLLTRLFSVLLSNDYVFIVVSLAILGSGIGAILAYKIMRKGRNAFRVIIVSAVLLPISYLVSISIMYMLPYEPTFMIYIPAAVIPFVLGGIITSLIFKDKTNISGKLYLMDLLGAGIGSVLIINLMNSFGFIRSVLIVGILAIVAALAINLFYRENKKLVWLSGSLLITISIIFFHVDLLHVLEKSFVAYYTSPSTVIGSSNETEDHVKISFSKWDAISKTDVLDVEGLDKKIVVTDGGAAAPILQFDGNLESVQELYYEVNSVAFSFGKNDKSLVIGSGGGKDVLFALLGGSKQVDAVEINPSTIEAVNYYKEFSGDIYHYPGVNLYIQDGRYFIENSKELYDNIYLSMVMTNTVEANTFSLAEYYIFTQEAFQSYFDHLNDQGKLTFMVHDTFDLLKVVNTGIKVLMDRGVEEKNVTDYFVIINGVTKEDIMNHGSPIAMPLVIFKDAPFSQTELEQIQNAVDFQNRTLLHAPGEEVEPYKFLKTGEMTYQELVNAGNVNIKPINDNSPFFYNRSKLIPEEMIFILLLILVIWIFIRFKYVKTKEYKKASIYFAALGMAFMLVEIPLVQKLVLYFGSSSIAFSFVLFSLLMSGGIGSYLSGTKFIEKRMYPRSIYTLVAGLLIVALQFGLNTIVSLTQGYELFYKFIIIFMALLPIGLFMGMAFPSGLKKIGKDENNNNIVPLMYGVNGIFSVFGSTVAVAISMIYGFQVSLYTGAAIYILLFLLNPLRIFDSE